MAPHWKDEARLITAAKQGRQQLEEQFAREREELKRWRQRADWNGQGEASDSSDDVIGS